MQDHSDSMKIAEPEENGPSNTAESPVEDDPTPNLDSDSTTASTVLAEVLPGVAVVFGEVPAELEFDLIDFGLVSAADRKQISTVLASIGNTATVGGNLGNAFASMRGLYRLSDATQALLKAGGTLAIKDGANLGTVISSSGLAQARFIPLAAVSAAGIAAAIGPALAMVALQMTLSEVTGLVRTNIALTSQVLTTVRQGQWATLTGLVATVDDSFRKAQEIGSVPQSLWDTVASKEADLKTVRDQYRQNIGGHVQKINQLDRDARGRREYLEMNAKAIIFDAYALRSSLQAWTEFQMLKYARARAAGLEDAGEARHADSIARDTPEEVDSALAEITSLVDSLTRELRIVAELPGRATMPLTRMRRNSKAARLTCAQLLTGLRPSPTSRAVVTSGVGAPVGQDDP